MITSMKNIISFLLLHTIDYKLMRHCRTQGQPFHTNIILNQVLFGPKKC
jgi:hypothetical protein